MNILRTIGITGSLVIVARAVTAGEMSFIGSLLGWGAVILIQLIDWKRVEIIRGITGRHRMDNALNEMIIQYQDVRIEELEKQIKELKGE